MDLSDFLKLQPKQQSAIQLLLNPKTKYLLYGGAMGGGKSYLLRWSALLYLIYLYKLSGIKYIPVGLFSEDYPTLKDRQVSRILREFPKWIGELRETKNEGLGFFLYEGLGGGRILLRNLDDPSKYMSTEFAGIFVEELTRDPEQTFMDLRNRLRYPGVNEVKFMGATNPGGIGHGWVKKYFIDQNSEDREQDRFAYVHANAYDNEFISPEYIKQLESLPEQQRKAYLDGSWDVFAGQYFTEFNRRLHVIPPFLPKKALIIGGMDWGRANPFSFHLATVTKVFFTDREGDTYSFYRVRTFFEVYGTNRAPQEWAEIIEDQMAVLNLTLSDVNNVQADPSIFNKQNDGSDSIRDQFVTHDSRWRIIKPGSNDRKGGWAIMQQWLRIAPDGLPYWQITANNAHLIRTLPELVHNEPPKDVEDVDTEGEDHAPDDQRYMLKSLRLIEGISGRINPKEATPQGNAAKFYHSHEDAGQMLLDVNKFVR